MKMKGLLVIILLAVFSFTDLPIIPFVILISAIVFCFTLIYIHREQREEFHSGLVRQSRESVAEENAEYERLLRTRGIDSPATQEALKTLIRAQYDLSQTYRDAVSETAITELIRLVKK